MNLEENTKFDKEIVLLKKMLSSFKKATLTKLLRRKIYRM